MTYLLLVVLTLAIGLGSQAYVNAMLKKYSRKATGTGLTGAQFAEQMLQYYGITNVPIRRGHAGEDYFDPKTNSITLSPDAYEVATITAMATACHEVGHACQYAQGYTPMKVRTAIVPVANFASNTWILLFFLGIALNLAGLVDLAIIVYAAIVIFALVTLPVEFNASNRARTYLAETGVGAIEQKGASTVLTACALTYVASALSSAIQLLYLVSNRDN